MGDRWSRASPPPGRSGIRRRFTACPISRAQDGATIFIDNRNKNEGVGRGRPGATHSANSLRIDRRTSQRCAVNRITSRAFMPRVFAQEVRPTERKLPELSGHVAPSVFRRPAKLLGGVRASRVGPRSMRAAGTRQLGGTVRLGVCLIRVPFSTSSRTLTARRQHGTPGGTSHARCPRAGDCDGTEPFVEPEADAGSCVVFAAESRRY